MTTQEKTMTTKEVANRLIELCRQGDFSQAQRELYAEDAESIEPESAAEQGWDVRIKGLQNIFKKGEKWQNMVEQTHQIQTSAPIFAGNYFAVTMKMDLTMKEFGRNTMEELCVYRVRDGKIVSEQFFSES